MTRLELVVGFPVNEFTQSERLFDSLYFINCKGGLEKWGNSIKGGFLEQHFQQFSEVSALADSPDTKERFKYQMSVYRRRGLEVIMHTPFVRGHEPEPIKQEFLEFDFEWLVVPKEYRDKPVKDFYMQNNGDKKHIQMSGLEAKLEDVKQTIDLASDAGIEVLTMHVTAPGIFLDHEDMVRYADKICELSDYIQDGEKNVTLAIETGGITPNNLVWLYDRVKEKTGYEIAFNLDTAHLLLDLMEIEKEKLKDEEEEFAKKQVMSKLPKLNQRIVDFYKMHKDKIKVLHLTQTSPWVDLHSGIEDSLGILSCNEELIRRVNRDYEENRNKRYLMIESEPTKEGLLHFVKAKKGEINGDRKPGKNESLMMFMGRPCNGKSGALDILTEAGYISDDASVLRTDVLREKYKQEAFSMTGWVSREQRQIVYDECFRRAELALRLKQGTAFDATFDQRENRKKVYELAQANEVRDLYVFEFYCKKDEALERLRMRHQSLTKAEETGIFPEGRLCMRKTKHYHKFDAVFEDFDVEKEFINSNGLEMHVMRVDTTTGVNSIELYNPDQKTRLMAEKIANAYLEKFDIPYKVEVKG